MNFQYKIKPIDIGKHLVTFLSEKYTYYSQEEWKNQIIEGNILVNENKADINFILNLNDEISFSIDDFIEPEVDKNFSNNLVNSSSFLGVK